MNEHPGPGPRTPTDPLTDRITRALRAREDLAPDADALAGRIEARASALPRTPTRLLTSRGARIAAAGVVTSGLAVAGAGAAAAANPYSPMARTVENVVQAVGIEWSAMPDGYTREQYEAFWGAGYTPEDIVALERIWSVSDTLEVKARAGQMLLDGEQPPVAPGTSGYTAHVDVLPRVAAGAPATAPGDVPVAPATDAPAVPSDAWDAFFVAGYRWEDAVALAELWGVDTDEAKARAAQAVLDGQPLPVPPSAPEGTWETGD